MSLPLRHPLENVSSLDRVFEDLLVRFVINCPPEDLSSVERELFHFEEASWFYTDFVKLMNPTLPSFKIKSFAKNIIRLCPLVWKWDIQADEALQKFSQYKKSIPVRGAAIFNEKLNKILLVKGTESDSWSFPRGKISKDEDDVACCIREVREEIGFNLSDYIDENQFIERNIQGKNYKIFIISGVPESYDFKPHVRNEIEKIEWRDFRKIQKTMHKSSVRYYLINSMMRPLSMWVRRQRHIIGDDQLRQYAEDQLKLLLGITKEEQVDPGRELLNMLHSAVQQQEEKQENLQEVSEEDSNTPPPAAPIVNQMLFPPVIPPTVMGFRPFAPFPFMNGNVPPFLGPQRPPDLPPVDNQQNSQPQEGAVSTPLTVGNPPQPIPRPDVSSLSRPPFAQDEHSNQCQKPESSSKQLLELLNSKKQAEQQNQSSDTNKRSEETHVRPPEAASSDLLRILKNPQSQSKPSDIPHHKSNTNDESTSADEYEDFESGSEASSDESDQQEQQEEQEQQEQQKYQDRSNHEGYEDFESDASEEHFRGTSPPPELTPERTPAKDISKKLKESNAFKVSEASREASRTTLPKEDSSASTESVKPKPKIKLLKRGENLADVLPKESPSATSNGKSPSSEDLLGLLRKPQNNSKPQDSPKQSPKKTEPSLKQGSSPFVSQSPLHLSQQAQEPQQQTSIPLPQASQQTKPAVNKFQQSPEEELLGMLKSSQRPQPQREDQNGPQNDSHQLLNLLNNRPQRNSVVSPPSDASASPHDMTNAKPVAQSVSHAGSSELLDILKKPVNGNSQSPSQIPYGFLGGPLRRGSSYGAAASNELLGILHRK